MFEQEMYFATLFDVAITSCIPCIPINLYSYSTRRWPRISGGTDRCPHCHYIAALAGLFYYPIFKSATKTAEFPDGVKKSIWLRYKYEGRINYLNSSEINVTEIIN